MVGSAGGVLRESRTKSGGLSSKRHENLENEHRGSFTSALKTRRLPQQAAGRVRVPRTPVGLVLRVTPVHTAKHNRTRDERRSFEFGNQVLISSHRKPLWSKAVDTDSDEGCAESMKFVNQLFNLSQTVLKIFARLIRSWQEQVKFDVPVPDNEFFKEVDAKYMLLVDAMFVKGLSWPAYRRRLDV